MHPPTKHQVSKYLHSVLKEKPAITYFGPLVNYEKSLSTDVKKMGYGSPYLIEYTSKKTSGKLILSTMRIAHGFGHDYRSDRVENLIMSYDTWNNLPKHCKILDFGAFSKHDSSMLSLGDVGELFLLRPMIEGVEYAKDLERILEEGKLENKDIPRSHALALYLAKIHSIKNNSSTDAELYLRKLRDTVGHGECIFGLADSFPLKSDYLKEGEIMDLEKKCVEHRWRLKSYTSRLSKVHGDFHPWNILFSSRKNSPTKFSLLDRSRGEWGEPADDVCALSINYIFSSLRKYGVLHGEFKILFDEFLNTYLSATNDSGILDAMPLFYVFRCLVIASPVWYPTLSPEIRRKIFNFAGNLLDVGRFDPKNVNQYFRERK